MMQATAGLRLLEGNAAEQILQAVTHQSFVFSFCLLWLFNFLRFEFVIFQVRDLFRNRSSLNVQSDDAVAIVEGTREGSYLWV